MAQLKGQSVAVPYGVGMPDPTMIVMIQLLRTSGISICPHELDSFVADAQMIYGFAA